MGFGQDYFWTLKFTMAVYNSAWFWLIIFSIIVLIIGIGLYIFYRGESAATFPNWIYWIIAIGFVLALIGVIGAIFFSGPSTTTVVTTTPVVAAPVVEPAKEVTVEKVTTKTLPPQLDACGRPMVNGVAAVAAPAVPQMQTTTFSTQPGLVAQPTFMGQSPLVYQQPLVAQPSFMGASPLVYQQPLVAQQPFMTQQPFVGQQFDYPVIAQQPQLVPSSFSVASV